MSWALSASAQQGAGLRLVLDLFPSFLVGIHVVAADSLDGIRGEIWISVRLEFVGSSSSAAASAVRMFTASRLPRSLYPFQFILGLVEELVVRWCLCLGPPVAHTLPFRQWADYALAPPLSLANPVPVPAPKLWTFSGMDVVCVFGGGWGATGG